MAKMNLRKIMYAPAIPEREPLTPEQLVCYSYHPETFGFLAATQGDESPREPGVILWPAHTTTTPPLEHKEGYVPCWFGDHWEYKEDHRGEVWYTPNNEQVIIGGLGTIPPELVREDVTDLLESWDNQAIAERMAAEQKATHQRWLDSLDPMDFPVPKYIFRIAMANAGYGDEFIADRIKGTESRFWYEETNNLNWMTEKTQLFLQTLELKESRLLAVWDVAKNYGV